MVLLHLYLQGKSGYKVLLWHLFSLNRLKVYFMVLWIIETCVCVFLYISPADNTSLVYGLVYHYFLKFSVSLEIWLLSLSFWDSNDMCVKPFQYILYLFYGHFLYFSSFFPLPVLGGYFLTSLSSRPVISLQLRLSHC